ncbi:ATP-binding protein [Streptomyces olivoreticuli]
MNAAAFKGARWYSTNFSVQPSCIAIMRQILRAYLGMWGKCDVAGSVQLGLTELLTNIHEHARSNDCVLLVEDFTGEVRVTVSDFDPSPPIPRNPGNDEEDGRGLTIVQGISCDMGIEITPVGKSIWFSVRSADHSLTGNP